MTESERYVLKVTVFDMSSSEVVGKAVFTGHVPNRRFLAIDIRCFKYRFRQYIREYRPRNVVVHCVLRRLQRRRQ